MRCHKPKTLAAFVGMPFFSRHVSLGIHHDVTLKINIAKNIDLVIANKIPKLSGEDVLM